MDRILQQRAAMKLYLQVGALQCTISGEYSFILENKAFMLTISYSIFSLKSLSQKEELIGRKTFL
jgi:hypothetical protein